MLDEKISHTFEAGRRGKPDELESQMAQLIGAYFLEKAERPRFDLRVTGDWRDDRPHVHVGGEVSQLALQDGAAEEDIAEIVRFHYNKIHQENRGPDECSVTFDLKPQADPLATNGAAGDSGNPIAVAVANAPNLLPWERYLAVGLRDLFDGIYQSRGAVPSHLAEMTGIQTLTGLRADGKINVNASYYEGVIEGIDKITLAIEHDKSLPIEVLREKATALVNAYVADAQNGYGDFVDLGEPRLIINGRGDWNQGGWQVDAGTREAKPYRDGFSSHGCNEDSITGEDGTKVSGTGTFLARLAAVELVSEGLADYARVTLDYSIGSDVVDVNVFTHGTGKRPQEALNAWVRENVPLQIGRGIALFGLDNPEIYRATAEASDLFQDRNFPWNQARQRYLAVSGMNAAE